MIVNNEILKLIDDCGELISNCSKIVSSEVLVSGSKFEDNLAEVLASVIFIIDKHNLNSEKIESKVEELVEEYIKMDAKHD